MNTQRYNAYLELLRAELIPALGCTEPIAIAYAAAQAAALLGTVPEGLALRLSGNIIKNVQGVTVPNSDGLKGIEAAAILGALGGDINKGLNVLDDIDETTRRRARDLIGSGYCQSRLEPDVENLYLLVRAFAGEHSVAVEIEHTHTNITKIIRDDTVIYEKAAETAEAPADAKDILNVRDILEFADTVQFRDIETIIGRQIACNTAISEEGLRGRWGARIGQTILASTGDSVYTRARARAAAGSDARMSGCSLPVIIVSGSGNQGITASLPVIAYAEELGVPADKLYRALVVSDLVTLHQKHYIGRLSAYCGAVCAACGSGAGITYLYDGDYDAISRTIINTIVNVGGIVCDGAKPSCAAKIASSVDAAILAHNMSMNGIVFGDGEGLVQKDVEQTIRNIGQVGREGMRATDTEILQIMLAGNQNC